MLALSLGGRTVDEWRATMSQREFLSWQRFYMAHPFDDAHRYHRPAALVASSMSKVDMPRVLAWLSGSAPVSQEGLEVPPEIAKGAWSESDRRTMRALAGS